MRRREVKEVKEIKKNFKTLTLKCESCGSNISFQQNTTEGLLFTCPNCKSQTLVKSSSDGFIREYLSGIQSSSDKDTIEARETTLATLDDGTRKTSSIRKEETNDLTIRDKLSISIISFGAATGLWFLADWFRHLAWEGKGDIFYILGFLSGAGVAALGLAGLNFIFGIEDGILFNLPDAKSNTKKEPQSEIEEKNGISLGR